MIAILVLLVIGFVFIAAPIGYAIDIKEGLEASKKPESERTYQDADAIWEAKATIISIAGGTLFVLFLL